MPNSQAHQLIFLMPCFIAGESMTKSQSCTINAFLTDRFTSAAPLLTSSSSYAVIATFKLSAPLSMLRIASTKLAASQTAWLSPCPLSTYFQIISPLLPSSSPVRKGDYLRGGIGCTASPASVTLPWWLFHATGTQYWIWSWYVGVPSSIQRLADRNGSANVCAALRSSARRPALSRDVSRLPSQEVPTTKVQSSGCDGEGISWTIDVRC